jgi:hypothetical protein
MFYNYIYFIKGQMKYIFGIKDSFINIGTHIFVQTGPVAHPASCTMGTGSFPGVKQPGRGIDHPPPPSADVKERVALYFYSPSVPSWPF